MRGHERFLELLARRPELSPAEEIELRRHLDACPECRQAAADYARQTALLRSLPIVDPPASLRAGVFQEIRRPGPVATPFWRRPVMLAIPLAVAAALVIAVGIGQLAPFARSNHSAGAPTVKAKGTFGPLSPSPSVHAGGQKAAASRTKLRRTPAHRTKSVQAPAAPPPVNQPPVLAGPVIPPTPALNQALPPAAIPQNAASDLPHRAVQSASEKAHRLGGAPASIAAIPAAPVAPKTGGGPPHTGAAPVAPSPKPPAPRAPTPVPVTTPVASSAPVNPPSSTPPAYRVAPAPRATASPTPTVGPPLASSPATPTPASGSAAPAVPQPTPTPTP